MNTGIIDKPMTGVAQQAQHLTLILPIHIQLRVQEEGQGKAEEQHVAPDQQVCQLCA